jgi:16S rRNA (guanine527-N7)-methyltransferase
MQSALLKTSGKIMQIGSKEWAALLIAGARTFDIELKPDQIRLFADHARELMRWNKTFNITAITDPRDIALKHYLDSLPAARHIPSDAALLDIGSGGGFPGIPLKILLPSLTVTLIDASRKKVNFLKHLIRTLKLEHIEAIHGRVEHLANDPCYRQRFDAVISRALCALPEFIRLAQPFLAAGGMIIALTGRADDIDLNDLRSHVCGHGGAGPAAACSGEISIENYILPFVESQRSIVILSSIR